MGGIEDSQITSFGLRVTEFADYRAFLKAYYADARVKNPRFSYGAWAKKLHTKDTSTLTKIIKGQRDPGPRLTEQFISYFKFTENEAKYFRSMVQLEKLQGESSLRLEVLDTLGRSPKSTPAKTVDTADFANISEWYSFAIRQMTKIRDFQSNTRWISKRLRFGVTEEQVQNMLNTLIRLGFLKIYNHTNTLTTGEPVDTPSDIPNSHIRKFHLQMLNNAAKSINDIPVEQREFTSLTLAFNSSRLTEAKKLIRKFKSDFDQLMSDKTPEENDSVYQFQVQFFPLTQNDSGRN
ncbi:MAG: hypothetical protein A4S09_04035 [Proteobacteria bacterium SG_bin7]|nr:MAG: hypothetical protein A4S09_04035 [Proteobacteria bacterium SG_bin7]